MLDIIDEKHLAFPGYSFMHKMGLRANNKTDTCRMCCGISAYLYARKRAGMFTTNRMS